MQASRRRFLIAVPVILAPPLLALASAGSSAPPRIIKVEARKFRYAPDVIELKLGEAVVLELTALDFPHGFSIPDWHIRRDLVMGVPVQVPLKPERSGRFAFLCDNFCGSGHEEMSGIIVVSA